MLPAPRLASRRRRGRAEFLAEFANKIKTLGPAGYLRSTSHRAGESARIDEEED
ncbi:MAG: hypothetical protein WKF43_01245 [Acidimicrobiales bacterium]